MLNSERPAMRLHKLAASAWLREVRSAHSSATSPTGISVRGLNIASSGRRSAGCGIIASKKGEPSLECTFDQFRTCH